MSREIIIGIYKITNLMNGKVYIGQSWDCWHRWKRHKSYESNTHLRASFKKYGIENFSFEILRSFHGFALTDLFLTIFEQKFIEEHNARDPEKGYNFRDAGPRGRHSEESKAKMSLANKGKHPSEETIIKRKISNAGFRHSEEARIRMSEIQKSLKHKPLTEEWKAKISAALKGKHHMPCKEDVKEKLSAIGKEPEERERRSQRVKDWWANMTEEERIRYLKKQSEAHLNSGKCGRPKGCKGRNYSLEERQHRSALMKKRWASSQMKGNKK